MPRKPRSRNTIDDPGRPQGTPAAIRAGRAAILRTLESVDTDLDFPEEDMAFLESDIDRDDRISVNTYALLVNIGQTMAIEYMNYRRERIMAIGQAQVYRRTLGEIEQSERARRNLITLPLLTYNGKDPDTLKDFMNPALVANDWQREDAQIRRENIGIATFDKPIDRVEEKSVERLCFHHNNPWNIYPYVLDNTSERLLDALDGLADSLRETLEQSAAERAAVQILDDCIRMDISEIVTPAYRPDVATEIKEINSYIESIPQLLEPFAESERYAMQQRRFKRYFHKLSIPNTKRANVDRVREKARPENYANFETFKELAHEIRGDA